MVAVAHHKPRPASAPALVRAAIVELSRSRVFKTVTTSPSLEEVTVVEPRLHREAATSHVGGQAGRGTIKVVVVGGAEYLRGDARGWANLLQLEHARPATLTSAASLAGNWYRESTARAALVDGFGPVLSGVGHVFCTGGCSLSGAKVVAQHKSKVVVEVPAFGGKLVLDTKTHLRPVELVGTGAHKGLMMRFAYPRRVPAISEPAGARPAPSAITG